MQRVQPCCHCGEGTQPRFRMSAFTVCCDPSQFVCNGCLRKLSNPVSRQGLQCQVCGSVVGRDMFQLKLQFLTYFS